MKKILLLSLLMISFLASGWAQDTVKKNKALPHHDWQKIAAMKKQYFQDSLKLEGNVAKAFWKVYDENCRQEKAIHEKFKAFKEKNNIKTNKGHVDMQKLDEKTAVAFMEEKLKMRVDLTNLEMNYFQKLKEVLPEDKLLEYYRLDKNFKKQMVREKHKAQPKKKKMGTFQVKKHK